MPEPTTEPSPEDRLGVSARIGVVSSRTMLPPLVLTGGPAAGKSTTARQLAATTTRTAFVDVDDVRQLVKNGGAAPWEGDEGTRQQLLGVLNASALASGFLAEGFNVTLTDVVTGESLLRYRQLLPDVMVIRLSLTLTEAWRRASLRPTYLTDAEFLALHHQQSVPLPVDHDLDVTTFSLDEQVCAVRALWGSNP